MKITKKRIEKVQNIWKSGWDLVDPSGIKMLPILILGSISFVLLFLASMTQPVLFCLAPFVVVFVLVSSWLYLGVMSIIFFAYDITKLGWETWYESQPDE